MENLKLIELNESHLEKMMSLYKESFEGEPWHDDWTDHEQLKEYVKEVSGGYNSLNYGLETDGNLVGIALGQIRHWWEGTNYNIEEFCISPKHQKSGLGSIFLKLIENNLREKKIAGIFLQTDDDMPAYKFYEKNGFTNLTAHVSLYKSISSKD